MGDPASPGPGADRQSRHARRLCLQIRHARPNRQPSRRANPLSRRAHPGGAMTREGAPRATVMRGPVLRHTPGPAPPCARARYQRSPEYLPSLPRRPGARTQSGWRSNGAGATCMSRSRHISAGTLTIRLRGCRRPRARRRLSPACSAEIKSIWRTPDAPARPPRGCQRRYRRDCGPAQDISQGRPALRPWRLNPGRRLEPQTISARSTSRKSTSTDRSSVSIQIEPRYCHPRPSEKRGWDREPWRYPTIGAQSPEKNTRHVFHAYSSMKQRCRSIFFASSVPCSTHLGAEGISYLDTINLLNRQTGRSRPRNFKFGSARELRPG